MSDPPSAEAGTTSPHVDDDSYERDSDDRHDNEFDEFDDDADGAAAAAAAEAEAEEEGGEEEEELEELPLAPLVILRPLWDVETSRAKIALQQQWEAHFYFQFVRIKTKKQKSNAEMFKGLAPGMRPDTLILRDFPVHWWDEDPSCTLRKSFSVFGRVRQVQVVRTTAVGGDEVVLLYVQYRDLVSFEEAVLTLKGAAVVHAATEESCAVHATFDPDGFFSQPQVRKRRAKEEHRAEMERKRVEAEELARKLAARIKARRADCNRRLDKIAEQFGEVEETLAKAPGLGGAPAVLSALSRAAEAMQIAEDAHAGEIALFEGSVHRAGQRVADFEKTVHISSAAAGHSLPSLEDALLKLKCDTFLELLRREPGQADQLRGCTVFVPSDEAFLGSVETWDSATCWGLHVVPGPYRMQDLSTMPGTMTTANMTSALCTGVNGAGRYTVWIDSKQPRLKARVLRADAAADGGILLHKVDRIMFLEGPPG